nr:reverse transcriptase domain, reverse transcriptase zinc-binding domain protein [Tanacetum cinerariifolium]
MKVIKSSEDGTRGCPEGLETPMDIYVLAGMENVPPIPLDIVMHLLPLSHKRTARSIVGRLILAAAAYHAWNEHNNRLFKNAKRTPKEIQDMVMVMVWLKLITLSDVGADMEIDDPPSDKKTMRPRRNLEKKEEKPRVSNPTSSIKSSSSRVRWLTGIDQEEVKVFEFFDCLGSRQGVEDLRELLHMVELHEAKVFQVSNDDTAVAQRRLEDKHPEEKINTDCLVKEQEKEYQTMWKIKTSNVLDLLDTTRSTYLVNRSPSSAIRFNKTIDMNMGFNESEKYKKTFIGYCVGTGSMQVLHRFEFEVEPLGDHTFEVEP